MGLSVGAVRELVSRPTEDALKQLRQEQRELCDRLVQVNVMLAMLESVRDVIGIRTDDLKTPAPSTNGNGRGVWDPASEMELPRFAAHGCEEASNCDGPEFELDPRDHWVERVSP